MLSEFFILLQQGVMVVCSMILDYRPHQKVRTKDISLIGIRAAMENDIETASYCLAELSPERRKRSDTARAALELVLTLQNIEPIPWLEEAATITHNFASKQHGSHFLYIVLLSGIDNKMPGYGLYVGQSYRTPEERFGQHKNGYKASRWVRIFGNRLLPSLYSHLNPLDRKEAMDLESKIAEALANKGVPVRGGH